MVSQLIAFPFCNTSARLTSYLHSIILDRYTASYIGRPGTIHERDYDTSFPSEDEPDEHEQWRPIRPDGTDWSVPPKNPEDDGERPVTRYPPTKAHTLSCFNAAGALAVVINRVSMSELPSVQPLF